jgi:phytoene desaturase
LPDEHPPAPKLRQNNIISTQKMQFFTDIASGSAMKKTAIVIGSGIGGLAMALRLQSLGFATTVLERMAGPGGRAAVRRQDGFVFDMGPTVITVPHFIEELFALAPGQSGLQDPDFPAHILNAERPKSGISGGPATSKYVKLVPILPFYRIYFDDGSFFDYDGDPASTLRQIQALAPEDVAGYHRFHQDAKAIFERGFLELGYSYFGDVATMLRVTPDLIRLDALRSLFSFVSKYFQSDKMRQVFSFETLLVGGNPLSVPAIYAMIHFVEKTWGIHFAHGGTGALVQGFIKKLAELGGDIRYQSAVKQINVTQPDGRSLTGPFDRKLVRGVTLEDGTVLTADVVVSNADYATTYLKLLEPKARFINNDPRVKMARQSMSLFVVYFGFRADGQETERLRHHNIILGPRYQELLRDIFDRRILAKDFSQYLHIPTLTDPSLAPAGHHAAYTLVPVPHNGSKLDWDLLGEPFMNKILGFLDDRGYIPGLRQRIVTKSYISPDYFEGTLDSYLGNAFGVEPILAQSAFFRPHNRSEDVKNLYLVGASSQPGAGTPSVMMSAKMTARLVAEDWGL